MYLNVGISILFEETTATFPVANFLVRPFFVTFTVHKKFHIFTL